MENRRRRRRRRRRRKYEGQIYLVLFCVAFICVLWGGVWLLGAVFDSGTGSAAACGIQGHFTGDGRQHKELKTDCGNGHAYACECDSWIVPEGGTYYIGVTSNSLGDYNSATNSYNYNYRFPCGSSPQDGDVFVCGDYEYRYGYYYNQTWIHYNPQSGWGVRVLDTEKSSFNEIIPYINNVEVVNLTGAYAGCSSMVIAPKLPASATNLTSCFDGCTSLVSAPLIPEGVTIFANTFQNCVSLAAAPILPQSALDLSGTFRGCSSLTSIPGVPGCVLNMAGTFEGCSSLEVTPNVPITVTCLSDTFANCKRLVTPPDIPGDITHLDGTFLNCISLKRAPKIPECTISLKETFKGCVSLDTAPNIPGSVTDMTGTFEGCTSLKGYIVIFANPLYYQRCLKNTQINEILGSTELKRQFLATKGNW